MARQQGILKFKGNIGSFSMYKTQDGFQGREKSGIEPGRVLNDPAFQRTRENLAEFAQVAQSAKLLRVALRSALDQRRGQQGAPQQTMSHVPYKSLCKVPAALMPVVL
jgi:hypothetical protein